MVNVTFPRLGPSLLLPSLPLSFLYPCSTPALLSRYLFPQEDCVAISIPRLIIFLQLINAVLPTNDCEKVARKGRDQDKNGAGGYLVPGAKGEEQRRGLSFCATNKRDQVK